MKYSRIAVFFIISAVMCVYARSAQMLYLTEERTGFLKSESKTAAIAVLVFIFLAITACALLAALGRPVPKAVPRSAALCLPALLITVSMLYEGIAVQYVTKAEVFVVITKMFAILSAAVFIVYAVSILLKKKLVNNVIYLIPSLFFLFKLISIFTVYNASSAIASNVIYLLSLCALTVFCLVFARLQNGLEPEKNFRIILPCAVTADLLAMCCCLPHIVLLVNGKRNLIHDSMSNLVSSLTFTLFITVYIITMLCEKKSETHKI